MHGAIRSVALSRNHNRSLSKGHRTRADQSTDSAATGYDAGLYAQLHRGTAGDIAFYLDAVRAAPQILELGCGFARILVALAQAGHQVTGLDISTDMLALAEQAKACLSPTQAARTTLVHGDMRSFQLDQRFDRVIIPYNGLYCMLSEAAVINCLRCAGEHLTANGQVVFDAYAVDDFHAQTHSRDFNRGDDDDEPIESLQWQGTIYDVYESCRWHKAAQLLHVSYRHEPRGGGEVLHAAIKQRYILTSQLANLCDQAGLTTVQLCADFNGTPLQAHAEHIVCIAQQR